MDARSLICPVCNTAVTGGATACPECQEDLTALILLDDLAPGYYNEGLRLAQQGKAREAEAHLQAALAHDPTYVPALVVLGKLSAQQEDYVQAIACWRRALEVDPANAGARAGIAKAEQLMRRRRRDRRLRGAALLASVVLVTLVSGALLGRLVGGANRPEDMAAAPATAQASATPSPTLASSPTPSPAAPTPTPASQLADLVRAALASDPRLGTRGIAVQQIGSAVRLSGSVPSQELKQAAETLAGGVAGVKAVDSTELSVAPPALVAKVQEALRADPVLKALDLRVEQVGSSVRLSGSAPSAEVKDRIIDKAHVEGVELVDGEGISVTPPPLAEQVTAALQADAVLAPLQLQVEQFGAGVRLTGSVPDPGLKLQAETVARGVKGVKLVDVGQVEVKREAAEYVVAAGDSLVSIAQRLYGDGSKWPVIYEANRKIVARPTLIRVGMRLVVPPLP